MGKGPEESLLRRVDRLEQELEQLKRELIHQLMADRVSRSGVKSSLFGRVKGGDVTEQVIEESKKSLFRHVKDL